MEIRLIDLEPEWLLSKPGDTKVHYRVDRIEEANGIFFVCPLCFERNNHERPGVHGVVCWSCGVSQEVHPRPGRWRFVGTSFHDLTLEACPGKTRSVLLLGEGCGWHGFITNGIVT